MVARPLFVKESVSLSIDYVIKGLSLEVLALLMFLYLFVQCLQKETLLNHNW